MADKTEISKVMNPEEHVKTAKDLLERIASIPPERVECLMGLVVVRPEKDGDDHSVQGYILGSDTDIEKMCHTLANVVQSHVNLANSDVPNDISKH